MPRDANGNYTNANLPVNAGETILASTYNTENDDKATELTDSLSRSAKGGMLAQFQAIDGIISAPGVSFLGELNSGLYRAGAGDVRISVQGTDAALLKSAGFDPLIVNGVKIKINDPVLSYIFNSDVATVDSTASTIVSGSSSGQPNRIGSPTKPGGTDFTPIGWSDDTGYVAGTATQAIIAAGGDNICNQSAGAINGGAHNFIKYNAGGHSAIGSGVYNVIDGQRCYIAAGRASTITNANSAFSFIGNGDNNNIVGSYSAILAGANCNVTGDYSFASGRNAKASANGVHLLKDDVNTNFEVTQAQQLAAQFTNGYRFISGNFHICDSVSQPEPEKKLHIYTALSAQVAAGNAVLRLQGVGNEGGEIGMDFFAPFSAGSTNRAGRIYGVYDAVSFAQARMTFQSITTGDVLVDTLSLKNGNTGVNVTSPAEKLHTDGQVRMDNLPTTNPGGTGLLWNDAGTLKIT